MAGGGAFSGHETIIKGTVQEVMFLFDVLEHIALLQPLPVEHSLAGVLGQAHLLEPLNKVAAKKAVSNGGLPTPGINNSIQFLNATQQVIA